MRAFSPSSQISHSTLLFHSSSPLTHSLLFLHPFHLKTHQSLPFLKPISFKFTPLLHSASKSNPDSLDVEEEEEDSELLNEDGVYIEVMNVEKNTRRIESRVSIEASLDAIWSILTDYERLADFIPGLAVSQLLQKGDNYARLLQIGQQNLAFGLKFNAKGVVDCYEKELEYLPSGMKRDILSSKWLKEIFKSLKENGPFCSNSILEAVRNLKLKKSIQLSRILSMLNRSCGCPFAS